MTNRKTTRSMKRWVSCILLLLIAIAALTLHTAHAQVHTADVAAAEIEATEQQLQKHDGAVIPEFVPTAEWQDILPGQAIPPGLHVRLNLATGKREAKFISEDSEDPSTAEEPVVARVDSHHQSDDVSVTVTTDMSGAVQDATVVSGTQPATQSHAVAVAQAVVDDAAATPDDGPEIQDDAPPAPEPNWNHEKIYEVLQALPQPPDIDGMDIHEAHAKLSTPEFRRHMIKLWKLRQEELKEAIGSMQDDAKYLAKLLDQLKEADLNGDTQGQVNVLEMLEWEVQDLDKTHVFNFIGGFSVVAEYLYSTNLRVRAHAAWLTGTAAKNYKDGQDWAINAGAVPKLVDSLSLQVPVAEDQAAQMDEVQKKAVYALSSLVRFNPRAQRLLLSLEGPSKLAQLMDDSNHPWTVQLKAVLFVHDLLQEEAPATPQNQDAAALQQLQEAFRSPQWCAHVAAFVTNHVSNLQRNTLVETIHAMDAQLPFCKNEFIALNIKETVETIQSAWQQDASLDDEERHDLVSLCTSFLSKL